MILTILAQAGGESGNTIIRIANQFGVRGPFLVAQIVNFIVVAGVLWYFAFKPVLANLSERQKKIDDGLRYAEEMKAKLEAAQQHYEAKVLEAQKAAQKIMEEAQKAAKEFGERQSQEAVEKANGLISKAEAAIELEKKKMLAEARTEIARLVVATTQRVLGKQLSDADRGRYNDAAARELTEV
jgi:F-type H+-transporting ATPase subunit b